jgi:replicative DNA helicase
MSDKQYDPETIVLANVIRNVKQREKYIEKIDKTDFKLNSYDTVMETFQRMMSNQAVINRETMYQAFTDPMVKRMVLFLFDPNIPPITEEVFTLFKRQGTLNRLINLRDYLARQINTAKSEDIPSILEKIREMTDVIDGVQHDVDLVEPEDGVDRTIDMLDSWKRGDIKIKSFIPELDGHLFLSRFVGMWIIAAPPSIGKTALLCDIGYNNATFGNPFCVFSLEMPEEMLRMRLAMRDPKVAGLELTDSNMTDERKMSDLKYVLESQKKKPFYVYDKTFNTFSIYSKSRAMSVSKRVRGIGVDYMQLMQTHPTDSDIVRVSTASTTLKLLTKGDPKRGWHPLAVLALSQYTGQGSGTEYEESGSGVRKMKKTGNFYTDDDFRWSKQIGMDADGCIHIRGEKSELDRVPVKLSCTKQRWWKANWDVDAIFDKSKQVFETNKSVTNETSVLRPREERDIQI